MKLKTLTTLAWIARWALALACLAAGSFSTAQMVMADDDGEADE